MIIATMRTNFLTGYTTRILRSNRRIWLDSLLLEHQSVYDGLVLDIGSRPRGRFRPPLEAVKRWLVADIEKTLQPDVVLDVMALSVRSGSIRTIKATELFEHVVDPEQGLRECHRILEDGGTLVLTVPFLFRIHGDPYDFQRWTQTKWQRAFHDVGFEVVTERVTGTFFTVFGDMIKTFVRSLPKAFAAPLILTTYPILSLVAKLDETRLVVTNPLLSSFHGGYFFVVRKQ